MANTAATVTGYPAPPAQRSTNPTAGIAYPYQGPPPPPSYNRYYNPGYPNQPYPPPRAAFARRFLAALIAFFFIIGAVLCVVWLVLRPRVPEFRVDSLSAAALNASGSQVSGTWRVGLTATNPSKKMRVSYAAVESSLYYRDEFLALATLPPFDQATTDQTTLNASFVASSSYVDAREARDISDEKSRGTVRFTVKIYARVWFRAGAWRPRRRFLRVLCKNLPVSFASNGGDGNLSGGSRDCAVAL